MAKTQVNIGMFERAGRASGQANLSEAGYKAPYDYSKGFTDSMKRASEATAAAKKTADLLKKNPNGVKIPKLTEAANQQVTDYLITKKPEIAAAHQVLRTGTDEEKLEATEFLNKVDKGVQQLNADFENAATKQAELLDMSSSGGYANSNTANQSLNFNDMANGHMAAGAMVQEDENGMPRLMYNTQGADGAITQQVWDTIDVGGAYDNSLYKLIEGDEEGKGFAFDILNIAGKTAVQKNPELWNNVHKPKMIKQVKNILKENPNAAGDLMFQEEDFAPILNGVLSESYPNLPTGGDGKLDEESAEYKAAIEELKGDGFQVNNDYFLEQLDIMLDEDFNKAMGNDANKIKINF
tara:strand:+ start:503 stop:1561 length:1059 start_codon:yes stop_codon:yes gene_type:complete